MRERLHLGFKRGHCQLDGLANPFLFLALNGPPKGAFGLFSDLLMGCFNLKFFGTLICLVFPLFVGF